MTAARNSLFVDSSRISACESGRSPAQNEETQMSKPSLASRFLTYPIRAVARGASNAARKRARRRRSRRRVRQ